MEEHRLKRELFFSLFEAAKQAESRLCRTDDPQAQEARKILAEALDRCYDGLRDWDW